MTGGDGAAKLCTPEPAYDLNAFTVLGGGRRVGLLLRPSALVGDFERVAAAAAAAAAAKGEPGAANASNPDADRFVPVGEETNALVDG